MKKIRQVSGIFRLFFIVLAWLNNFTYVFSWRYHYGVHFWTRMHIASLYVIEAHVDIGALTGAFEWCGISEIF